jgi:hypothetical protein
MVPAGSILDFTVRGTTAPSWWTGLYTVGMLTGDVADGLAEYFDQPLDVRLESPDTVITGTLPYTYSGTVRVRTRVDYSREADAGSVVANRFYNAAGNMPLVTYRGRGSDAGLPGGIDFPDLPWTWTIGLAAVAVLVLAWKFR